MNASMMEEYLQFIANRRLTQIGLDEEFKGQRIPSLGCQRSWILGKKRTSLKQESSNIKQVAL